MQLPQLNLPKAELKINKKGDSLTVFDAIRDKFLVLTPEEWVRQHLVSYFINHLGYSKNLFSLEIGSTYNQRKKRTDIVIYDREGKIWMLVECKAAHIAINQKVLEQALVYCTEWKPKYLVLSNGLKHFIIALNAETQVEILEDFPFFE